MPVTITGAAAVADGDTILVDDFHCRCCLSGFFSVPASLLRRGRPPIYLPLMANRLDPATPPVAAAFASSDLIIPGGDSFHFRPFFCQPPATLRRPSPQAPSPSPWPSIAIGGEPYLAAVGVFWRWAPMARLVPICLHGMSVSICPTCVHQPVRVPLAQTVSACRRPRTPSQPSLASRLDRVDSV